MYLCILALYNNFHWNLSKVFQVCFSLWRQYCWIPSQKSRPACISTAIGPDARARDLQGNISCAALLFANQSKPSRAAPTTSFVSPRIRGAGVKSIRLIAY